VGLSWREDSSNHDLKHLRNRLRHQVLPLLATINPNIHQTLARTADLLAAESVHADQRDRAALAVVSKPGDATFSRSSKHQTRLILDLFRLAQYDLATQRGVLRQAMLSLGIDLRTTGMEGIEALLDQQRATTANGPHPLLAGWEWTVFERDDALYLSLHQAGSLPYAVEHPHLAMPLPEPIPLPTQGALIHDTLLGGWQLHSSILAPDQLPANWRSRGYPWRFFCDAERCGELYLTTFRAGMSIAPLGMHGHRRAVGDILTDRKIPPYLRKRWPVVVSKGEEMKGEIAIAWLCGLVMAESVRVQPATRLIRQLQWHHIGRMEADMSAGEER
jgi:tRNA(Ile)-lysidine synthase